MNLKHKKLVMAVRVLFALFLFFSGIMGLLGASSTEGLSQEMITLNKALWDAGIIQLAKTVEILAGAMLLFNVLPALATLMLVPLSIGIFIINMRLTPQFLPIALLMLVVTAYLVHVYSKQYESILKKA